MTLLPTKGDISADSANNIQEGYVQYDLINFGTTFDPVLANPETEFPIGFDIHGIEIGPESDVDALKVYSRSFPKGYVVVTTRRPFNGYIKSPIIRPYYPNPYGGASQESSFPAADPPVVPPFLGMYNAQIIVWKKPPPILIPGGRAQGYYELTNYAAESEWWTGNSVYWVPTFGRKKIRLRITQENDAGIMYPPLAVNLWANDLKSVNFSQGVQVTQPDDNPPLPRSFWRSIVLDRMAPNGISWEGLIDLAEVPIAVVAGAEDRISVSTGLRPDWLGIAIQTLDGADPSLPGANLAIIINTFDD